MEIFKKTVVNFENEAIDKESTLSLKADRRYYTHQITPIKRKPSLSLRMRKFFIKSKSKRPMELGLHPRGVHWMGDAVFNSESGCINCRMDLEKEH